MSSSVRTDLKNRRYEDALNYLCGRIDYERTLAIDYHTRPFKLERMRDLLRRIGSPERGASIVHVAGTKGKGSTAAMIAAILTAAGFRTGLFTSPHLDRVEERIAIDARPCSPEELANLVERMVPVIDAMDQEAGLSGTDAGPTYFEITTAMALLHFANAKVDAAVLEVGLGGRLDSTNVCQPRVSVITSISFDHMKQLGNTLEAIAREKAGIIKSGVPVVSGVAATGPRDVIRETCRELGCRLIESGVDFQFDYRPPRQLDKSPGTGRIDFRDRSAGKEAVLRDVALGLLGHHQGANAAVALATISQLRQAGWSIPEKAIRQGLAALHWPARVELIARRPAIVVDAAHNLASVSALIEVLNESFSPRRRLLVFATTQEKDIRGMLSLLLEEFDEVILTRYLDNPRAVPVEELDSIARKLTGRPWRVCAQPSEAWAEVRRLTTADDLICVTGSFFIAAQMRQLVQAQPIQ